MSIKDIKQKAFKSGPFAVTDIHNAGTIFGVIYYEILSFDNNNTVKIQNEIILNRGLKDIEKILSEDAWLGTYNFDMDGKHVECILRNYRTNKSKKIYADLATSNYLICEVYDGISKVGKGQVFQLAQ